MEKQNSLRPSQAKKHHCTILHVYIFPSWNVFARLLIRLFFTACLPLTPTLEFVSLGVYNRLGCSSQSMLQSECFILRQCWTGQRPRPSMQLHRFSPPLVRDSFDACFWYRLQTECRVMLLQDVTSQMSGLLRLW